MEFEVKILVIGPRDKVLEESQHFIEAGTEGDACALAIGWVQRRFPDATIAATAKEIEF